jgi:hypothetical protein
VAAAAVTATAAAAAVTAHISPNIRAAAIQHLYNRDPNRWPGYMSERGPEMLPDRHQRPMIITNSHANAAPKGLTCIGSLGKTLDPSCCATSMPELRETRKQSHTDTPTSV